MLYITTRPFHVPKEDLQKEHTMVNQRILRGAQPLLIALTMVTRIGIALPAQAAPGAGNRTRFASLRGRVAQHRPRVQQDSTARSGTVQITSGPAAV